MSPAPMVRPPVMLMSEAEAATAQCSCTESALVCSVAAATAEALPVALVSLVIALKVSTPVVTDPQGSVSVRVATAVPGALTVPVSQLVERDGQCTPRDGC